MFYSEDWRYIKSKIEKSILSQPKIFALFKEEKNLSTVGF